MVRSALRCARWEESTTRKGLGKREGRVMRRERSEKKYEQRLFSPFRGGGGGKLLPSLEAALRPGPWPLFRSTTPGSARGASVALHFEREERQLQSRRERERPKERGERLRRQSSSSTTTLNCVEKMEGLFSPPHLSLASLSAEALSLVPVRTQHGSCAWKRESKRERRARARVFFREESNEKSGKRVKSFFFHFFFLCSPLDDRSFSLFFPSCLSLSRSRESATEPLGQSTQAQSTLSRLLETTFEDVGLEGEEEKRGAESVGKKKNLVVEETIRCFFVRALLFPSALRARERLIFSSRWENACPLSFSGEEKVEMKRISRDNKGDGEDRKGA